MSRVAFTIEDIVNTSTQWRKETQLDKDKLANIKEKVGHDLISPTNYIIGFTDLILKAPTAQAQAKELQELKETVQEY